MKKFITTLLFLASSFCGTHQALAGPIAFSFEADATDWPWLSRSFLPGTVTGILHGLSDDGLDQTPTAIEFTSDVSALGMTQTYFDAFDSTEGSGFDLVGGVIVDVSMLIDISDATVGSIQTRWNYQARNALHSNGGSGVIAGFGNANGFAGAIYGNPSESVSKTASIAEPVPEPASIVLLGLGLVGLGYQRRKQIKAA